MTRDVFDIAREVDKLRRRVDALATRLTDLFGEGHPVSRRLRPRLDRIPAACAEPSDIRVPLTGELIHSLRSRLSTNHAGRWTNRIPAA